MSKKITFLSVTVLFSIVSMVLASVIPTNTIFFTLLSSAFILIALEEHGIKSALLSFAAASILSFILIPNKLIPLFFVIFFGYYPVIKSLIERLNKLVWEWVLKLSLGGVVFFVLYGLYTRFFDISQVAIYALWLIFPVAAVIFAVYDLSLSYGLVFYKSRLRKFIIKKG